MMPVRNKELLGAHGILNISGGLRIRDCPEAVNRAIFIRHLDFRRPAGNAFIHDMVDGQPIIGIKHVDQIFIPFNAAHQLESVLLGRGEGLLMGDDAGSGVFQVQQCI